MSENRESWEKALASVERGWIRMHGRSKDSARSLAREAATLRATLEKLTAERDAAWKFYPLLKAEHDANQAVADAFAFAGPNSRTFKQAKSAVGEAHSRVKATLCTETEGSEG